MLLFYDLWEWYPQPIGTDMKQNIRDFLTPRGLFWALFFMSVGVFSLYEQHSRISFIKTIIEVGIFFVMISATVLRLHRKLAEMPKG